MIHAIYALLTFAACTSACSCITLYMSWYILTDGHDATHPQRLIDLGIAGILAGMGLTSLGGVGVIVLYLWRGIGGS